MNLVKDQMFTQSLCVRVAHKFCEFLKQFSENALRALVLTLIFGQNRVKP